MTSGNAEPVRSSFHVEVTGPRLAERGPPRRRAAAAERSQAHELAARLREQA